MKLDLHKHLTASVTLDNTTMISHDNSMVYGKSEDDNDLYIYIKNPKNGRSIKIHIKEYAKVVEGDEEIEDI